MKHPGAWEEVWNYVDLRNKPVEIRTFTTSDMFLQKLPKFRTFTFEDFDFVF